MNLEDFLKKYTAIPNKFVDEYYKFYSMCKKDMHGIEAGLLINYLGILDTKKFYERLRTNYAITSDFVIKTKVNEKILAKKYYLSFDCFEKICLSSTSSKGKEVREYMILLRKFITYYFEHITDKINDLAKTNNYVYIILVNKKKDIFKIGSTKNLGNRLKTYATGMFKHPDVKFVMIVEDNKIVEKCVNIFAKNGQYRVGKKIYKVSYDAFKELAFNCGVMNKELSNIKPDKEGEYDAYVVYDENESVNYLDLNDNIIGYEKGIKKVPKKNSKKLSKKSSKKLLVKKGLKKLSVKKGSKKISKKK